MLTRQDKGLPLDFADVPHNMYILLFHNFVFSFFDFSSSCCCQVCYLHWSDIKPILCLKQIKLELPCTITQIVIADARSSTENAKPALLRAYAKDLNNTASRFASLCSNALACMPSGTSTFQTEVGLSKCHSYLGPCMLCSTCMHD